MTRPSLGPTRRWATADVLRFFGAGRDGAAPPPERGMSTRGLTPAVRPWLLWGLLVVLWGWLISAALNPTPLVSRTWPDGACVVVEPAPFSCEALPDRYDVRWVAPEAGR